MRYANAAPLFPRNLARLMNAAAYTAPVNAPSPDALKAQRDRDARAFWASAHQAAAPAAAPLVGSRYVGGSIGTPRSAR